MMLSDLVHAVQSDIGELMEKDEDIDPQLMLRINGMIVTVDEIQVNGYEIILSPRGA